MCCIFIFLFGIAGAAKNLGKLTAWSSKSANKKPAIKNQWKKPNKNPHKTKHLPFLSPILDPIQIQQGYQRALCMN